MGKLLLFSIETEKGLQLLQTINTLAILDQKWCHRKINDFSILAVASTERKVDIYKLNEETVQLELMKSYKINSTPETLVLSLDWSTGIHVLNKPEILCSDSKGNIHLLELNDNVAWKETFHGHEYEAWIAGFYYWDTNIIFSGKQIIFSSFVTLEKHLYLVWFCNRIKHQDQEL